MPSEEKLKQVYAEGFNKLRPIEVELDRLRLTVFPEQGVIIVVGIIGKDETRQPTIGEVGKIVAIIIEKGCQIENIIAYPIAQGTGRDKMGAIIIYK